MDVYANLRQILYIALHFMIYFKDNEIHASRKETDIEEKGNRLF